MKTFLTVACLVFAAAASAAGPVFIYKYRSADGKMQYTDKPIKGGELIEALEYTPPAAASPRPDTSKSDAAGEQRIRKHLSDLEVAWAEVQASGKALAEAEARRAAGVAPEDGETRMLATPAVPAPTTTGGPMTLPSANDSLGTRRGGGRSPAYFERQALLEAGLRAASGPKHEARGPLQPLPLIRRRTCVRRHT